MRNEESIIWIFRKLALFFVLFSFAFPLPGQTNAGQLADNVTLKIAVIGPGDELYFWWGHIGLVAEDTDSDTAWFFDWGVFDFSSENFFVNFAFGRLIYYCAVSPAGLNYSHYTQTNRDITLYTLDLPAPNKEKILRYAENNMLPENRDYNYHHFRDNCATRIRDILDLGLDGQFREEFGSMPGRFTLRQQVRRHTWFNPFFDWLLNFLMGQDIDRPITVWDDMFLPSEIAMRIADYQYTGADGIKKPLVSSVERVNISTGRPAVLDVPRLQWPIQLTASVVFSLLLLLVCLRWRDSKGFRILIGLLQSVLGLFFGIAGSMLFFLTFFTDHDYTYHNSNIFFVNPLFLAAIPLGLVFAFTKIKKRHIVSARLLRALWAYVLLGGFFTMVIKLFPAYYQQNQVTQALIMPIALVMIFVFTQLGRFIRDVK